MSAAGGALGKDIALGESPIASGVVAALGLAACSLLALSTWRALGFVPQLSRQVSALIAGAVGLGAALPFKTVRERFACSRLALGNSELLFYAHGTLWFARKFPAASIRSIYEQRLEDDKYSEDFGPRWRLVIERSDGTRAKIGSFRNARIHDIVDELNDFLRSHQSTET